MSDLGFLLDADRACADLPLEVFFPVDGSTALDARRICRRCPVQAECLEYAIENPQYGVWGGVSAQERARIARDRGRSYNLARSSDFAGPALQAASVRRRQYPRKEQAS